MSHEEESLHMLGFPLLKPSAEFMPGTVVRDRPGLSGCVRLGVAVLAAVKRHDSIVRPLGCAADFCKNRSFNIYRKNHLFFFRPDIRQFDAK